MKPINDGLKLLAGAFFGIIALVTPFLVFAIGLDAYRKSRARKEQKRHDRDLQRLENAVIRNSTFCEGLQASREGKTAIDAPYKDGDVRNAGWYSGFSQGYLEKHQQEKEAKDGKSKHVDTLGASEGNGKPSDGVRR